MVVCYSCLPCYINFTTKLQLFDHNTIVHGESPAIDIEIVNINYGTKLPIVDEMVHEESPPIDIEVLVDEIVNGEGLSTNIQVIEKPTGEKQSFKEFECQYCGDEFSIRENLGKHMVSEHPRQTTGLNVTSAVGYQDVYGLKKVEMLKRDLNFPCIKCENSYNTKVALKWHKEYKHGSCSPCNICSKVFESKKKLGGHVRDKHSPKLHSCNLCGIYFSRKLDLERHIVPCAQGKGRKASQDTKFICEMCSNCFATNASLGIHVRNKHREELLNQPTESKWEIFNKYFIKRMREREVDWNCKKCSQTFKRSNQLKRHMKVHRISAVLVTGETLTIEQEDSDNFVCQVCSQEFGSMKGLGSHLKLVHPTLTFKCDQCGKEFPSKISMKQHRRRMHNATVFVCPLCLTEIRQKHNKGAHMKRCKERRPQSFKMLGTWEPTLKLK